MTSVPIILSFSQILIVLAICLYAIFKGHLEWLLGIYMAIGMAGGSGTYMFGPFAHTYVILVALFVATIVHLSKRQDIKLFPPRDKWIVPWMIMWWVWIFLLIILFKPDNKTAILMSLIPRIIAPLPIILLFADDMNKIKNFAAAYILTTLFSGWKTLFYNYGISYSFLFGDLSLRQFGIYFLSGQNYHWFSYPFAISLIMITTYYLYFKSSKIFRIILLICAMNCIYFLFLSGSRQSVGSVIIVLIIMISRDVFYSRKLKLGSIAILTGAIGIISLYILRVAPYLIVRTGEYGLIEAFNLVSGRLYAWTGGIKAFIGSPIWGTGFKYFGSHNLYIGTLAEQGLFGMGFLVGYLYFIFRLSQGIRVRKENNDERLWCLMFLSIIMFGLIHSMASGSVVSVWHLYWPVAFLWRLEYSVTESSSIHKGMMRGAQAVVLAGKTS
ncbi:MAG: O-antigen ligase family protein [Bacteroidetes bacterium]|nr:O-antigen ligase family protein [Bacteroidota bacterium]